MLGAFIHFVYARPRITPPIRSIFWQMPPGIRAQDFPAAAVFPGTL